METYEWIILIFSALIIGLGAGWRVAAYTYSKLLIQLGITPDKLERAAEELIAEERGEVYVEEESDEMYFKVEQHDGLLFAYTENDVFIAQSSKAKELLELVYSKFPKVINFRVREDEGYKFIKTAVEEA